MDDVEPVVRVGRLAPCLLGPGLLASVVFGRDQLFVRPWFAPVLVVTALALALLAIRSGVETSPTTTAVLLLPLVVGVSLSPGLVGRAQTGADGPAVVQTRIGEGQNRVLDDAGEEVSILDVVLAERQVGGVALDGRGVSVEGFVVAESRISRYVMACCAADARPVTLDVVGGELPPEGTWVRVRGFLRSEGADMVLRPQTVTAIPTPARPFL